MKLLILTCTSFFSLSVDSEAMNLNDFNAEPSWIYVQQSEEPVKQYSQQELDERLLFKDQEYLKEVAFLKEMYEQQIQCLQLKYKELKKKLEEIK